MSPTPSRHTRGRGASSVPLAVPDIALSRNREGALVRHIEDAVRLVCPASRGKGTRIFEDRQDLKLVEATSSENGVALLRYEIKK